jgi:predicted DCC family thiol-disulfide oxidoreductase YuxK
MEKSTLLTVYYDGLCRLCSAEIHHYKKQKGSEKINFMDITATGFNASAEGVDPIQVHKIMHVKKNNGELITEVAAFFEIWKLLPRYHWAFKLAQNRFVRPLLDTGYNLFAIARPYLPRRKEACADSPYCELKH